MYKDIASDLLEILEPVASAHGVQIVAAEQSPGRLRVILDTPQGDGRVTLDVCAAFSREISHGLDTADLIAGNYTLEVSSPGVDRTLGREVDFERAVGSRVAIETRAPLDGRQRFKGSLIEFREQRATVEIDSGRFQIPFELIRNAKSFYQPASPQAKR